MFAGTDAAAFRELYDDLAWLFDALKDRELDEDDEEGPGIRTVFVADRIMRVPLRLRVRRNLEWAERYTDDVAVVRAWDNVFRLVDRRQSRSQRGQDAPGRLPGLPSVRGR